MNSQWDQYSIEPEPVYETQQPGPALMGASGVGFGENTKRGLFLILLGLIINIGIILFPQTGNATTIDELTSSLILIERITIGILLLKIAGLILILNDVGKFVNEMNQHRTQYNNNLTVIAEKINKKL